MPVTVNMDKAKEIAHDLRRKARNLEFDPLDRKATIPSMFEQVEQQRQEVRNKYADLQTQIDAATDLQKLSQINTEFNKIFSDPPK